MGANNRRQVRTALAFATRLAPIIIAIILLVKLFGRLRIPTGPVEIANDVQTTVPPSHGEKNIGAGTGSVSRALVVASTSNLPPQDVAWLEELPPQWKSCLYNYVTDKPLSSDLAVPVNKGNEAMVYMTYIIDHYDTLPDVVLFHHAHRHGWHQFMDSIDEVRQLRVDYVQKMGYVSLRCLPGCENVIQLADYAVEQSQFLGQTRAVQLTTLLDDFLDKQKGELLPVRLASPCCAQFAASREAIQRRSRAWWVSLRQWLVDTPLLSMDSGRLMEHTWHIWLGSESVFAMFMASANAMNFLRSRRPYSRRWYFGCWLYSCCMVTPEYHLFINRLSLNERMEIELLLQGLGHRHGVRMLFDPFDGRFRRVGRDRSPKLE